MAFDVGQPIVRRDVLRQGPWLGQVVYVVEDSDRALVTYLPEGSPFGCPPGDWPTPKGRHPWHEKGHWRGHGPLMVHVPGEAHAVWHFWRGEERAFTGWYVNLQQAFRRTPIGFDTQDLELDIVVAPDGSWQLKDDDLMEVRIAEGRFSDQEVEQIRAYGADLCARLDAGEALWDPAWRDWEPRADWTPQPLPEGWERVAW